MCYNTSCVQVVVHIGMSPSGKAPDFDSGIRRFESCHPSQFYTVRYELARRALYEHLRSDPNTCLVECSERNDPTAVQAVRDWVAEYVR